MKTSIFSHFAGIAIAAAVLAGCGGSQVGVPQTGAPAVPSVNRNAPESAPSNPTTSATRFLPGAKKKGAPLDGSDIIYSVNPHPKPMTFGPPFPLPSQCVAQYGYACYTPALIRTAYNIPSSLTGAGQTIVLIEAYGSPTLRNDLQTFDAGMGLSDPTLNIFYPTGHPKSQKNQGDAPQQWAVETSEDAEWAHAIAPAATIDVVVAANQGGNVINLAEQYAVSNHLGNVISMSFAYAEARIKGGGNNLQVQQADAIYQQAETTGITLFASSGDQGATTWGYSQVNPGFPSSDPLVTAVGGTTLFLADDGTYQSENVWNDSNACPFGCLGGGYGATGGAPSLIFAAPPYQQAFTGSSARETSDVAFDASDFTIVPIYFSFPNTFGVSPGWYTGSGTSVGSPTWAGIIALADQAAGHGLGLINPTLYAIAANPAQYAADFHDITVGNNDYNGPGFNAGSGYDMPTGLGTPNAANLISDLVAGQHKVRHHGASHRR